MASSNIHEIEYSKASSLNTMRVCIPRENEDKSKWGKYWIIYIHGGAWRDPKVDASSFDLAQSMLLKSSYNTSNSPSIAGLASLNYRLSPHPDHPAPPSDPARNAHHPNHINDVLSAIAHLQSLYPHLTNNYILVGHSCGATLALQVAMSQALRSSSTSDTETTPTKAIHPPLAVVGIEGIYDLPALVDYHTAHPIYETFATSAFGPNRDVWREISPTSGRYETSWPDGRLVLLGHSREDELVEWEQVELMEKTLRSQGFSDVGGEQRVMEVLRLEGLHNGGWQKGGEVVKAIERALEIVESIEEK